MELSWEEIRTTLNERQGGHAKPTRHARLEAHRGSKRNAFRLTNRQKQKTEWPAHSDKDTVANPEGIRDRPTRRYAIKTNEQTLGRT